MYKCICGREFDNSQSFNGHRSHCREHLGDKKYEINLSRQRKGARSSSASYKKLSEEKLRIWISEAHTCENCGKVMTEKYASGRFCSRSCSNGFVSRNQSEESKKSKSKVGESNLVRGGSYRKWTDDDRKRHSEILRRSDARKKLSLSQMGKTLPIEVRKKISETVKRSIASGGNSGWKRRTRNFPERFWENVLKSREIEFKTEVKIIKKDIGAEGGGCYFLDFLLNGKVDLEIDGSVHDLENQKAHDIERNRNLEAAGYKVYRVKWKNPRTRASEIKEDIDTFLEWYKGL